MTTSDIHLTDLTHICRLTQLRHLGGRLLVSPAGIVCPAVLLELCVLPSCWNCVSFRPAQVVTSRVLPLACRLCVLTCVVDLPACLIHNPSIIMLWL